ncbi:MAG: HD domain-containing protein [Treponema sp.]|jgi:HD-GYP domain-containing protein (c-di-GMP phosphodiesterase class II)|nr:HD domain-containing protein [Treponema sp.]
MMNIRMDQLIRAIAVALDIAEGHLLGASTHHGKRISVLCAAMGRTFGMNEKELSALTTCALLHDSALTEYIQAEKKGEQVALPLHCSYGQRNAEGLLQDHNIEGFVQYHHEWADGTGPFGKKEGEFPLGAELIAIADMLDVHHHLETLSSDYLPVLRNEIREAAGTQYTKRAAGAMLAVLDENMLESLGSGRVIDSAEKAIPSWYADVDDTVIFRLARMVMRIIDYKSAFTRSHTSQIANRIWIMAEHYHYGAAESAELYLAAALHDIGKLAVPTEILEKPGKLDENEFRIIQDHVRQTGVILEGIEGFDHICRWASSHHEKLDGSGYHRGKTADEMDFNSRLLACIDIYQAVSEERPYHPGRNHEETIAILYDMADRGFIDGKIVKDLDEVMFPFSNQELPFPVQAEEAPFRQEFLPDGRPPVYETAGSEAKLRSRSASVGM